MYSQENIISKAWGLFPKSSNIGVPLKSLDINVQIINSIARVFYIQVYQNNSDLLLKTEFFFPISPEACFDSFEARFKDTVLRGVIKEKSQAKEEYKESVLKGNIAAYSEINQDTGDIMNVMIENIPPNTDISITYSYIEKLETTMNKFWCFRIFSTITPRYNGDLNAYLKREISLLASYPTVSASNKQCFAWNIQVEVQSPSPITFIRSPSHEESIITKFGNENHTCTVILSPNSKHIPNKDFVLIFANGRENKVDYLITPFEKDEYCAMVTLLADFEDISAEEAYKNFAKAKISEESNYSMDSVRGEYIFLIDRSGSMEEERIIMARSSLLLFLKSLPSDSYFNVVSFGSDYSFLYESSQKYSNNILSSCSSQIEKFDADMGGTEIYGALHKIFDSPPQKGYPRFIFLLTDGDVSNTQQVLDLINANNDKARVFTIGIGNGCSSKLIIEGASNGRGRHEFVQNTQDIYGKVISLLDASLSPSYSDMSLEAENFDAMVKSVSPDPTSIPFLLNGQPVTFFLFIREAAFHNHNNKMPLKLRLYDSRIRNHRTIEIHLDIANVAKNDLIPKLAIHDMMKRLETQKNESNNTHIVWMSKEDIKQNLLDLSLKYGILCQETAFFCETVSGVESDIHTLQRVKVVVPTILSKDYENNNKLMYAASFCDAADEDYEEEDASEGSNSGFKEEDDGYYTCKARRASFTQQNFVECLFESSRDMNCKELKKLEIQVPEEALQLNTNEQSTQANISKPSTSYLDIIMKQSFEGFWDPEDQSLRAFVLKDGSLPPVPKEILVRNLHAEKVWITICVLLWLEVVYQSEKQAWRLIFKKGCEWLKSVGVEYGQVKDLAKQIINV